MIEINGHLISRAHVTCIEQPIGDSFGTAHYLTVRLTGGDALSIRFNTKKEAVLAQAAIRLAVEA